MESLSFYLGYFSDFKLHGKKKKKKGFCQISLFHFKIKRNSILDQLILTSNEGTISGAKKFLSSNVVLN
jgi:hypothetical protein